MDVKAVIEALRKGHAKRKMDVLGAPQPAMVAPWSAEAAVPALAAADRAPARGKPTDGLPSMYPTPRNKILGTTADLLRKAPIITGESGEWMDARAYGDPMTRGTGQATKLDNPQGLFDLAVLASSVKAGKLASMLRKSPK